MNLQYLIEADIIKVLIQQFEESDHHEEIMHTSETLCKLISVFGHSMSEILNGLQSGDTSKQFLQSVFTQV